jgi:hypothetical protein
LRYSGILDDVKIGDNVAFGIPGNPEPVPCGTVYIESLPRSR